jgi:hypothetical protein
VRGKESFSQKQLAKFLLREQSFVEGKKPFMPCMILYACNLSIWEAEAGR